MTADIQAAKERLTKIRDRSREAEKRGNIFDPSPQLAAMAIEARNVANAIDTVLTALAEARRQIAERDEAIRAHLCAREALEETPVQRLRPDDERFKAVSDTLAGLRSALVASPPTGGAETFSPEAKRQAWSLIEDVVASTNGGEA